MFMKLSFDSFDQSDNNVYRALKTQKTVELLSFKGKQNLNTGYRT